MKKHATTEKCPFCGQKAVLTTEWGWIDDDTCTATLCCPACRTTCGHAEDACAVAHVPIGAQHDRDAAEATAIADVLAIGLPAE